MDKTSSTGTNTYHEIVTQSLAWADALRTIQRQADALRGLWQDEGFDGLLFTGCGSTYYLSLAAASLFQSLVGVPAQAAPAGELLFYPEAHYTRGNHVLLVASSRSGATTETVEAVRTFREQGRGRVIVITNNGDKPLAELADLLVSIPSGQEKSVAQTRSFSSMYVAATAMAALFGSKPGLLESMKGLPAVGERLMAGYEALAREIGSNPSYDRFYFLGGGPRFGLACEAGLKMKEMSLSHSEPFPFLEFRHGPMSMVGRSSVVIGLLSESHYDHEKAVLKEVEMLEGHVVSLGESGADVNFQSSLPEEIQGVLFLPVLQLMAYHRAISKGLNPDHPAHLSAVVRLDTLG